jgi:hypothetical protein
MYGLFFPGNHGGNLNKHMKIKYRKPTLVEQMSEAIATAKQPIDYFELTQSEFQSVFTSLDKTKSGDTITYSYKGISIKVANE